MAYWVVTDEGENRYTFHSRYETREEADEAGEELGYPFEIWETVPMKNGFLNSKFIDSLSSITYPLIEFSAKHEKTLIIITVLAWAGVLMRRIL